ncbi:tryptophan--tRNA ligase [Candidatus Woesearchaeota archaeon]|nr:tryptophan--tRNA ligase [Candidatus Woesearchaeota archaeon]
MENSVTPWEVKGKIDYDKLIKEFGMSYMPKELPKIFNEELLFRREIVYGHRNFNLILDCIKNKKQFAMMTGLMPSGKMHIGHAMVARQFIFYQSLGAKVYITVADIEAYNTRNPDMEELKKVAIEEYLLNYIALGLDLKKCDFYFQSKRSDDGKKSNSYYSLAQKSARHITFNEIKSIYGDITPGKLSSALLQVSDMLHPQLPEFEGQINVIVPVGTDQDPHIKLAHDIMDRMKGNKFSPLSSTYHIFMPGLKGGKMSSSDPLSYVALTDTPEEAEKKIKKYAFSGGKDTLEEHRKLGGNPDIDISYQWLRMFFEPDDNKLQKIHDDYKSGKLLSGELKQILIEKVKIFLKEHQKKRELAKKQVEKFL